MPLVVRVARDSSTELPQPARLHSLLRSSSCTNEHDKLLRWWESLAPPELHSARYPSNEGFALVWSDVDPTEDQLRAVWDLVHRVPGRKIPEWHDWSVLAHAPDDGAWTRYVPSDESSETTFRVASTGFTDALETACSRGDERWEDMATVQSYEKVTSEEVASPQDSHPTLSGHGEMLCFRFPTGVAVDGVECGAIAARLRDAVLARVPDPLPPEVSGHGANGRPHVACVPLLDVGGRRSRGDAVGAAVIFPREVGEWSDSVRSALLGGSRPLWVPVGSVRMDLVPVDGSDSLPQAHQEHWVGPARTWASVTPMVHDRFSKRGNEEDEIARCCTRLGLPQPSNVEVSRDRLVRGSPKLRPQDLPRRDKRPCTHVRIEFPVPVQGPLLLGAQRHVGMGLCVPELGAASGQEEV